MSNPLSVQKNFTLGGKSFYENTTIVGNFEIVGEYNVPAAQPATQTTGGGTTAGNLTMTNSVHGIVTGQRVDLYWVGGYLIGATVGTVAGTTVPITASGTFGPSGVTALPVNTTAVQVATPQQVPASITGNNLQAVAFDNAGATAGTSSIFTMQAGATITFPLYILVGGAYCWYTGNGSVNPVAGAAITQCYLSHNDTTGAVVLRVGILSN